MHGNCNLHKTIHYNYNNKGQLEGVEIILDEKKIEKTFLISLIPTKLG